RHGRLTPRVMNRRIAAFVASVRSHMVRVLARCPNHKLPPAGYQALAMPDRDEIALEFLDQLPYEPYPVQEKAILAWFDSEQGVLISAPTGTGKTLIAEAALFEALHTGKTAYYTTTRSFRRARKPPCGGGFSRKMSALSRATTKSIQTPRCWLSWPRFC
ncbi:MAG: ATP-binding protein, partial [Planctomycetota bacterium]|nr:ATP-binding protein [Planctomycetota bacterium]